LLRRLLPRPRRAEARGHEVRGENGCPEEGQGIEEKGVIWACESFGATHAWAEIFVTGAGWISFDPTNRGVGGANLIPVAVARDLAEATPVSGSFIGMTDAFQGMSVEVVVSPSNGT